MNLHQHRVALLIGAVALLFIACDCDDDAGAGATTANNANDTNNSGTNADRCGDGVCNPEESESSCPEDCVGEELCEPGTVRCKDERTREVCEDDGEDWLPRACESGACVDGDCLFCTPGEVVGCESPFVLERCDAEGAALESVLCEGTTQCEDGACVEVENGCASDDECGNDTFCELGLCVDYEGGSRGAFNENCVQTPFSGAFEPEIQCQWTGGEVEMQPVVIDLDMDEVPEIVFFSLGVGLVAIRGDDCTEVARASAGLASGDGGIAVGDIDNDGMPEIVAMTGIFTASVTAYDHNLVEIWAATVPGFSLAEAPAIADMEGDGTVEVIVGGTILNGVDGSVKHMGPAVTSHGFGPLPAIADIDGDGLKEILYGNLIIDSAGQDVTPEAMAMLAPGHIAVADFDPDTPEPELAVVSTRTSVRIQRLDGEVIFGPYEIPDSMWAGGAPNVADFDGDGQPEIGTAGTIYYGVFDMECDADPLPADCVMPGLRWIKPVEDSSSGSTGSTTFDFEGDGRVEVVYADECFLRVYDGTTGDVRFAVPNTSGTLIEAPVVADVDGDFNSEIVVGSNLGFSCTTPDPDTGTMPSRTSGLTVWRDVTERWVHSRPIWNQNSYHITNVEDDGTIPMDEEPSWERFNSYRQNRQADGKDLDAPDLTADADTISRTDCGGVDLVITVHNRGTQPVPAGIEVVFFDRDPERGGQPACTAQTSLRLAPGEQEEVRCTWADAPDAATVAYAVVDVRLDGETLVNRNSECFELNNWAAIPVDTCE